VIYIEPKFYKRIKAVVKDLIIPQTLCCTILWNIYRQNELTEEILTTWRRCGCYCAISAERRANILFLFQYHDNSRQTWILSLHWLYDFDPVSNFERHLQPMPWRLSVIMDDDL